jgi:hypothetical protein
LLHKKFFNMILVNPSFYDGVVTVVIGAMSKLNTR